MKISKTGLWSPVEWGFGRLTAARSLRDAVQAVDVERRVRRNARVGHLDERERRVPIAEEVMLVELRSPPLAQPIDVPRPVAAVAEPAGLEPVGDVVAEQAPALVRLSGFGPRPSPGT